MSTRPDYARPLAYARQLAAAQVQYARGRKAAERRQDCRPPKHCPDPAAWVAGYRDAARRI
jgi:hypothetical protein